MKLLRKTKKMKNSKLQKEINSISKLKMITGELFIVVNVKALNWLDLEEKSTSILENLIIPEGLEINENLVSRKELRIYISFKKA